MRVRAYRNLNSKTVQWSIYSEALRCVIAHCDAVVLDDASFTVDASALRYMRDVLKKRWVVGWVTGEALHVRGLRPAGRTERGAKAYQELVETLTEPDQDSTQMWFTYADTGVRFDPWTMETFQHLDGTGIERAHLTRLEQDGKCWVWEGQAW